MIVGYILIIGLILFDQLFKLISIRFAPESGTLIKVVIKDVFEFHHLINRGASFGMLNGKQWLFAIITIIALVIFGYFFTKINFKTKKLFSIAVVLFIAGTLGNAIDRLFRDGGVIDMIQLPFLNSLLSNFGIPGFTFNLADLYLNFAIVLYIIDLFFLEPKRVKKDENNS